MQHCNLLSLNEGRFEEKGMCNSLCDFSSDLVPMPVDCGVPFSLLDLQ